MAAFRKWMYLLLLCSLLLSFIVVDANPDPAKNKKNKNKNSGGGPSPSHSEDSDDDDDDDIVILQDNNDPASSLSQPYPEPVDSVTSTTSYQDMMSSFSSLSSSEVVLVLEVEPRMGSSSKDVEFSKNVFNDYHRCMCKNETEHCDVVTNGKSAENIRQRSNSNVLNTYKFTHDYLCRRANSSEISCKRMTISDLDHQCDVGSAVACGFKFTLFGNGCELNSVSVYWDLTQTMKVDHHHWSIMWMFSCAGHCSVDNDDDDDYDSTTTESSSSSNNNNGQSRGDEDSDDDDSINPAVIGAIGACIVILIILLVVFSCWVYRKKQKTKSSTSSSQPGGTTSFDGVDHGRIGGFQKKQSQADLKTHGKSNGASPVAQLGARSSGYSNLPSSSTANGNTASDTTNGRVSWGNTSSMKSSGEPAYASIEDSSVNDSNVYASLDEASKYSHPYKALHQPVLDPKLRPPMPLPAQATSQPVPYYSVAQPIGDEAANENSDVVSGQYIDIIDENAPTAVPPINNQGYSAQPSAPPIRESTFPKSGSGSTPYNSGEGNTTSHKYFELEREISTSESVPAYSDYRNPDNTNPSAGYETAGQFTREDHSGANANASVNPGQDGVTEYEMARSVP